MKKHLIIGSLALLWAGAATAQPQQRRGARTDTTIKNTTLDVYQVYKPELKPYVRPEIQPSLPPALQAEQEPDYKVPQQTLFFSYRSQPLRPLALGKDTSAPPKQNYVKLGGGNLSTITGEAGIGNLHGKDWKAALLAHYDSREGNIQGQKTIRGGLVADGQYTTSAYTINAGVEGDYRRYYLYGYNHDLFQFENSAIAKPFAFFSAHAALSNREAGPYGIFYAPRVEAAVLTNTDINPERSFRVTLPFSKKIDSTLTAALSFDEANSTRSLDSGGNLSNNVFSIRPAAIIHRGSLDARIGLSPTFGHGGNSYLLPEISARYRMPETSLAFEGGWMASIVQNTFRELSLKNPFLRTPASVVQTREDEAYIGAELGIGSHLSLHARGAYRRWSGLPLFINVGPDGKQFDVIYDAHASAITFEAGAKYQFAETFVLSADGAWYAFMKPTYGHVYGEPTIRLRSDLSWHILPELQVHAYLGWLDGIWVREAAGNNTKLDPTLDLGGGAEYNLVKQLALFADVSNILNNKNERWQGYASYGFNIWGGVRFRF